MNDTQQTPKTGGSKLIWLVLGCFGCLGLGAVLFFLVLGAGVFGIMKAADPYKADARQFLSQAAAGNIDAAYDHFSDELKQVREKPTFKAEVEANPDLFDVTDSTFNFVKFENETCQITGSVTGKSGKVYGARFRYVTRNNAPKMIGYKIVPTPIGEND